MVSPFDWSKARVLITGGTGSFGRKFVELMMREYHPRKLIVFSRDELKQHEMQRVFPDIGDSPVRYFIGDVRDKARLDRALDSVDVVVHAAALKQVPSCEYNPFEAVQTNIIGTKNIIDAALDRKVERCLLISTDKAVNPVNLYGATKLCAERICVSANFYAGDSRTRFAVARYGNVVGSRGSVLPVFIEQRKTGTVTVTDARMTRFWLTLDMGVRFVIHCIEAMEGGEVFVPKIPSMSVTELARRIAPECRQAFIGIRPGEKLHETLLTEDEARSAVELPDFFVVQPLGQRHQKWSSGRVLREGFRYSSDKNEFQLSGEQIQEFIEDYLSEPRRRTQSVWPPVQTAAPS